MKKAWINVHVVTVDEKNRSFPEGGLLCENGRILAVGESAQILAQATALGAEIVDGGGKYLFPGLINTHTHLYQELTKGWGSDLSLEDWFPTAMAPVGVALKARHMVAGVALGLLEALHSATTTVADYMQHQPVEGLGIAELELVEKSGIRMVYGRGYRDIGKTEVVETAEHIFADVADLRRRYEKPEGKIRIWLAPASGWALTDGLLRATRRYADENGIPIMIHLFETEGDERDAQKKYEKSALARYEDGGLLGSDLLAVHSVALGEEELAAYARHGVRVSYNPVSNMYLASGVCPVGELLGRGLTVGLGTDGAGSNNDNDLLEAMKLGALLQKVAGRDPQAMTAEGMLRMATIEAARALGMEESIGSLEPGKYADFFLYDPLLSVKSCPVRDIVATLVYSGDCRAVDTVVVQGETLLENGRPTRMDEREILLQAQALSEDLRACVGQ